MNATFRPTLNSGEQLMTIDQVLLLQACAKQLDQCSDLLASNEKLVRLAAEVGGMADALMELSWAYEDALNPIDLAWDESVPQVGFKLEGSA